MLLLDTHIWIWWVHGSSSLSEIQRTALSDAEKNEIRISAISLWEIAKLVEYGRLRLPVSIDDWFDTALGYPGLGVIPLTPAIVIESTRLPGDFHKDPADQMIVATARIMNCPIVSSDQKILSYPHVMAIG